MARASLEELNLDYEDFLRQRQLPIWNYTDPRQHDLVKNDYQLQINLLCG